MTGGVTRSVHESEASVWRERSACVERAKRVRGESEASGGERADTCVERVERARGESEASFNLNVLLDERRLTSTWLNVCGRVVRERESAKSS